MSRIEGVDGREAEGIRQDYLRSLSPEQKAEYLSEYERRAGQDYSDEMFYATGYYDTTAEGAHSISIGELALLNADERKVNAENLEAIAVFHATTPFRLHRFALIDLGPLDDPDVFDRTVEGTTYESTEEFLASLDDGEADGDEPGTVSPAPNSEPAHVEQEKPFEVPEWPKPRVVRDEPQA